MGVCLLKDFCFELILANCPITKNVQKGFIVINTISQVPKKDLIKELDVHQHN